MVNMTKMVSLALAALAATAAALLQPGCGTGARHVEFGQVVKGPASRPVLHPQPQYPPVYCPRVAAGKAFEPPPGATIIYRQDFDHLPDGQSDGWAGEIVQPEPALVGSVKALKVGGGKEWTSRKLSVPIAEETVLSFYVFTADAPTLFVQAMNETAKEESKSHYYLYPNRDYGRWVHVWWPLRGTLVDGASNWKIVPKVGDVLSDIQIHLPKGATILVDDICIYTMTARGKLQEGLAYLNTLPYGWEIGADTLDVPQRSLLAPERERLIADGVRLAATQAATQPAASVVGPATQPTVAAPDAEWPFVQPWYDRVQAFRVRLERARQYKPAARLAWPSAQPLDYAVGTQHAMDRLSDLHWRYPFTGQVTGEHQLRSARNEYESFQAVILPFTHDLRGLEVRFSDLRQVGGLGRIKAENCTWRTQPYVQQRPTFGYPGTEWIAPTPDPLLPGQPFDLPAHRWAPLWITVYTPPGARPGDYEGTMTVRAANSHALPVRIKLHVWDYAIPLTGRFRTQTSFSVEEVAAHYGRPMTPQWRREWYAWMLSYRFTPTQQYGRGFSPHPDDIDFCRARGNNIWILAGLSYAKTAGEINLAALRERYELAKKKGILGESLVYIGDETSDFPLMRAKANLIHANFPGLKVMIGGSRPRQELVGYIDIWDPTMIPGGVYGFDPKEISDAQQRGEETMWYVACSPQHPFPNVQMGDPLYAARMLFWLTWKYNITGFEYYCFAIWGQNPKVQPRWPESPWNTYSFDHTNGDGQLCYPGPDGQPVASVRLEAIRDGIEDWEALFVLQGAAQTLKEEMAAGRIRGERVVFSGQAGEGGSVTVADILGQAQGLLKLDDPFCQDTTHWEYDPRGLQARRDQVG